MSVGLQQGNNRPPYVIFSQKQVEDRVETQRQGKYVARSVDYVTIRQAGHKDSVDFEAVEWLDRIGRNPGFLREWVDGFRTAYDLWKKGKEAPLNGTPVRDWPSISPAQAEMLAQLTVYTVEDLAAANESVLQRIGIGARELKQKAQIWLETANNTGKVVEEITATRVENAELKREMASLREFIRQQNGHPLTQAGHVHNLPPALTAGSSAPLAIPVTPPEDPFA